MMSRTDADSALESSWSVADAESLYQLRAWGQGYFAINETGHLVVRPAKIPGEEIDLFEIVETMRQRGLTAPILLRFSNVLTHRLRELRDAFAEAMEENEYEGQYLAVYPIKVNQQRSVVEEVYRCGGEFGFGLEVGSKPELLAVMAVADDPEPRLIICNGFKDDDYIRSVTLAAKLGREILPVVEKLDELDLILKHAEREGIRPRLGVRIKLAARGIGRWQGSSGNRSKFGLRVGEVVELLGRLRERGMEDCLELVHCHPGSQVHDVHRVKNAIAELAHVYAELIRLGATGLRYLDVGGGLAVDYDGSRTSYPSSMNYTLWEYASEVVYRVASVCADKGVPHPILITESGRALAAYQSMLVVNVLGSSRLDDFEVNEDLEQLAEESLPQPILDLVEAHLALSERRVIECFHDAIQAHEQALHLFRVGYLSLEERALAERLFWKICAAIRSVARRMPRVPDEVEELEALLADVYFCNFSVFQSLPDSWAIDQIFPVAPIHRLTERPTRRAALVDMTCDSDGKIDRFVGVKDVEHALQVHELVAGQDYYLGVFLTGAYQETLGDLHNLFGDTHVINIALDGESRWRIEEIVDGDSAAEVLGYFQYDVEGLWSRLEASCRQAVERGSLTRDEADRILAFYRSELEGYTYLEPESSS